MKKTLEKAAKEVKKEVVKAVAKKKSPIELNDAEIKALQEKKRLEKVDRCRVRVQKVLDEEGCVIDAFSIVRTNEIKMFYDFVVKQ